MDVEVIESLRHEMVAHRDANKAISMKAYMKEHFDFLGVSSPQRRLIQKQFLDLLKESDPWDVAYLLWDQPEREFQYIALDFLKKIGSKKYAKEDHHQLRELITTKSWWDTVDGLASNNVGTYFLAFPEMRDQVINEWRNSDNMWLKRSTLIFQLKYAEKTDFELMKDLILQFDPIKEFFIQKAIGWALRQHSKVDPQAVRDFVATLNLSTVARREAYKYI